MLKKNTYIGESEIACFSADWFRFVRFASLEIFICSNSMIIIIRTKKRYALQSYVYTWSSETVSKSCSFDKSMRFRYKGCVNMNDGSFMQDLFTLYRHFRFLKTSLWNPFRGKIKLTASTYRSFKFDENHLNHYHQYE